MITITCQNCSAVLQVAERAIGRRVRCKQCNEPFVVAPEPATVSEPLVSQQTSSGGGRRASVATFSLRSLLERVPTSADDTDETVAFPCEHCEFEVRTKSSNAGGRTVCPGCGESTAVPSAESPPAPTPESPSAPSPALSPAPSLPALPSLDDTSNFVEVGEASRIERERREAPVEPAATTPATDEATKSVEQPESETRDFDDFGFEGPVDEPGADRDRERFVAEDSHGPDVPIATSEGTEYRHDDGDDWAPSDSLGLQLDGDRDSANVFDVNAPVADTSADDGLLDLEFVDDEPEPASVEPEQHLEPEPTPLPEESSDSSDLDDDLEDDDLEDDEWMLDVSSDDVSDDVASGDGDSAEEASEVPEPSAVTIELTEEPEAAVLAVVDEPPEEVFEPTDDLVTRDLDRADVVESPPVVEDDVPVAAGSPVVEEATDEPIAVDVSVEPPVSATLDDDADGTPLDVDGEDVVDEPVTRDLDRAEIVEPPAVAGGEAADEMAVAESPVEVDAEHEPVADDVTGEPVPADAAVDDDEEDGTPLDVDDVDEMVPEQEPEVGDVSGVHVEVPAAAVDAVDAVDTLGPDDSAERSAEPAADDPEATRDSDAVDPDDPWTLDLAVDDDAEPVEDEEAVTRQLAGTDSNETSTNEDPDAVATLGPGDVEVDAVEPAVAEDGAESSDDSAVADDELLLDLAIDEGVDDAEPVSVASDGVEPVTRDLTAGGEDDGTPDVEEESGETNDAASGGAVIAEEVVEPAPEAAVNEEVTPVVDEEEVASESDEPTDVPVVVQDEVAESDVEEDTADESGMVASAFVLPPVPEPEPEPVEVADEPTSSPASVPDSPPAPPAEEPAVSSGIRDDDALFELELDESALVEEVDDGEFVLDESAVVDEALEQDEEAIVEDEDEFVLDVPALESEPAVAATPVLEPPPVPEPPPIPEPSAPVSKDVAAVSEPVVPEESAAVPEPVGEPVPTEVWSAEQRTWRTRLAALDGENAEVEPRLPGRFDRLLATQLEASLLGTALTLDVYGRNGYRILGLPANAERGDVDREITALRVKCKLKPKLGLKKAIVLGYDRSLGLDDPRESFEQLESAPHRVLHELFWPHVPEASFGPVREDGLPFSEAFEADLLHRRATGDAETSALATHALAVLYHNLALAAELGYASGRLPSAGDDWATALDYWRETLESDDFWAYIRRRVESLDDIQVRGEDVEPLRAGLGGALLAVNSFLARRYFEADHYEDCGRHLKLVQRSGIASESVKEVLVATAEAVAAKRLKPLVHRLEDLVEGRIPLKDERSLDEQFEDLARVDFELVPIDEYDDDEPITLGEDEPAVPDTVRSRFDAVCRPIIDEMFEVRRFLEEQLGLKGDMAGRSEFVRLTDLIVKALDSKLEYQSDDGKRCLLYAVVVLKRLLDLPLSPSGRRNVEKTILENTGYVLGGFEDDPSDFDASRCWFLPSEEADADSSLEIKVYKLTGVQGASVTWESKVLLVPRSRLAADVHSGRTNPKQLRKHPRARELAAEIDSIRERSEREVADLERRREGRVRRIRRAGREAMQEAESKLSADVARARKHVDEVEAKLDRALAKESRECEAAVTAKQSEYADRLRTAEAEYEKRAESIRKSWNVFTRKQRLKEARAELTALEREARNVGDRVRNKSERRRNHLRAKAAKATAGSRRRIASADAERREAVAGHEAEEREFVEKANNRIDGVRNRARREIAEREDAIAQLSKPRREIEKSEFPAYRAARSLGFREGERPPQYEIEQAAKDDMDRRLAALTPAQRILVVKMAELRGEEAAIELLMRIT